MPVVGIQNPLPNISVHTSPDNTLWDSRIHSSYRHGRLWPRICAIQCASLWLELWWELWWERLSAISALEPQATCMLVTHSRARVAFHETGYKPAKLLTASGGRDSPGIAAFRFCGTCRGRARFRKCVHCSEQAVTFQLPANTPSETDAPITAAGSTFDGNQSLVVALVEPTFELSLIIFSCTMNLHLCFDCTGIMCCETRATSPAQLGCVRIQMS